MQVLKNTNYLHLHRECDLTCQVILKMCSYTGKPWFWLKSLNEMKTPKQTRRNM